MIQDNQFEQKILISEQVNVQEEVKTQIIDDPQLLVQTPKDPDRGWVDQNEFYKQPIQNSNSQINDRKLINYKIWECIFKPNCRLSNFIGIITSAWNYFYSTQGFGKDIPLDTENVLKLLEIQVEEQEIHFKDAIQLFNKLFIKTQKNCAANSFWKLRGEYKTINRNDQQTLNDIIQSLISSDGKQLFIYKSNNQFYIVIGFEFMPLRPPDAYKTLDSISINNRIPILILGSSDPTLKPIYTFQWKFICDDLLSKFPNYKDLVQNEDLTRPEQEYNDGGQFYQQNDSGFIVLVNNQ